jgi:hypothetical protein
MMIREWLARLTLCAAVVFWASGPADAQETVDLELVLLADATGSIDDGEIRFQREGYATAITHPQVLSAIETGLHQRIAVTYVEWGDAASQEVVVPWTIISGPEDAAGFADRLRTVPRLAFGRNAIGSALDKAQQLIETNAIQGLRRVIDLSGDSANNWNGPPIETVRQQVISKGITINGLAILCRELDCGGRAANYDLERAFAERIIGGPGAFVVTADSRTTFASAVRRKLVLEIASLAPARGFPDVE